MESHSRSGGCLLKFVTYTNAYLRIGLIIPQNIAFWTSYMQSPACSISWKREANEHIAL